MENITIDDFGKLDIRIGTITSAEAVEGADKLVRLSVDIGEEKERTIVSGIKKHFPDTSALVGRQVPVLANLAPRRIRGVESEGMILYAVGDDFLTTVEPSEKNIPDGTRLQ